MAAKKRESKVNGAKLPKGFTLARQSLDGFFERSPGNSVQGTLRGSFKTTGKFGTKNVFRIAITEGETQVGDGEVVGPGAVIGLDETGYTSALADLEPGVSVYVRYDGLQNPKASASKENPHIFTVGVAD